MNLWEQISQTKLKRLKKNRFLKMQKWRKKRIRESLPDQAAELKKLNQKKLKRKIQNCRRKLNGMIQNREDLPKCLRESRKLDRLIEKFQSI